MNKVIVITGSSRGIGAATAMLAAKQHYTVCINYVNDVASATFLVNQITSAGGKAIAVKADISLEQDVIRLFEEVDHQLGRVTALVNNAGILETKAPVVSMAADRLQRIFSTNIIAPFICSREAIKRMAKSNGGQGGGIVNVSSTSVHQGGAFDNVDYAATKGALEVFTRGLSKEVIAEGIRVNTVRPGIIHTDIHKTSGNPDRIDQLKHTIPMQRGGYPEEVARAILWLLSDEASYTTGSVLDVSGGR